jgi:hypothetical protein
MLTYAAGVTRTFTLTARDAYDNQVLSLLALLAQKYKY